MNTVDPKQEQAPRPLSFCEYCGYRLRDEYYCPGCGHATYRGINEIVP